MSSITNLSAQKQALLEKYLRGELAQSPEQRKSIEPRDPKSAVPLSFGQRQMWLLHQMTPDTPVYNECVTIHLPGPLNVDILGQSFNEIIRRHEAWRTNFSLVDGLPAQVIHAPFICKIPVKDVRALPEAEREAEALRLATEDARIPFDLAQGPLLRPLLIRLQDEAHRLFLTLHHIIFDGVAIYQVFLPELWAIYEAFLAGQPSPLPDPPIQYADYACWQAEQLKEDQLASHLAYWKQQLATIPAALELPTDRPRPPVQTYRGSMRPFALSEDLTDALKMMSRREGVTLYMTLLAAFNTLLYRYTGQDDLLIGTATAGRNRPELQKMMGYFLNTVVLRTDLSGNPSFRALLAREREVLASAVAHEDVPFEYLVKELQPERNLSANPLFQVLLTLEPPLPLLSSGWTLTQMDVTVGISKFDLSLELDDRPEGLIGRFEYNTDLFDTATIERMVAHWQTLLASIAENPTLSLHELDLLTEAEHVQIRDTWNDTRAPYPDDRCLHSLFEDQVERTPDALAIVYENEQLTYRELNARANQLARYLCQVGVGPGVLVGLYMERSLFMVIGLLGILKAGGAYVPLDPSYPSERLSFMLEDAGISLLLTQHHLSTRMSLATLQCICLDTDAGKLSQQDSTNVENRTFSTNLAYVIYTSGSTGRPKGVQIPHRAVVNFLISMRQRPGLTATDTLLAVTTLSFDIAALELFLPLIVGARLIVASSELVANGAALADALERFNVTVMQATPVTWRLLLAAGWHGSPRLRIFCGGEALPLELARQLLPRSASLWNLYGPTETTIWSTVCKIEPDDEVISIGRPIANTELYVLDKHFQPVPIGVPGELYIGGDGLAHGYLNRPELTSERFLSHPLRSGSDAQLYRTGDLARYRPDGTIELLGRLDHQVKVRGFRIELGEIEAVLARHPAVREALVLARRDVPGEAQLVAYIVFGEQKSALVESLREYLRERLPAYMLPAAYVILEALPLTPNGKRDRNALPAPDRASHLAGETFAAPTLMIHYQLLQIWEELLSVDSIGIRDNFFYLGGHSLLAARLINRIEQVFQKKIPLATLFAGPTIEALADALQDEAHFSPVGETRESKARVPVVTIQAGGSRRPFFFLHGNWDDNSFYCFSLARALGTDQPFYVLAPYKFDGLTAAPTYQELAAAHVEAMRAVQPEGPYLLGGFCNGGVIAFEMAQQLRAQGQVVDLLALLEPGVAPLSLRLSRAFIRGTGALLQRSSEMQLNWFLRLRQILRYFFLGNGGNLPLFPPVDVLRQDETGIYAWVAAGYLHREYAGKVVFFWASEKRDSRRALWGKVNTGEKSGSEFFVIPGGHFGMIDEHLAFLSAHLKMCLEKTLVPEVSGALVSSEKGSMLKG